MPDGGQREIAAPTVPLLVAEGPVLVFGGGYSNREATQALLAEAGRLGIPPTRMICTGDVVAYGADPQAAIDLIRGAGIATVMGNCEEQLAAGAEDCGCGFAPGSSCEQLSAAWFTYASAHVDDAARRWMAGLPRRLDLLIGGRRLAVVHGAPSRINRFVFASTAETELAGEIAATGTEGVIGGHCGLPFTRFVGGRLWHNAGVIGLPANDATARGWFSLLIPRDDGIEIRHLPLTYDHRRAAAAMRRARLPEAYAETLESGIWPNFDILPPPEQALSGTPLAPSVECWRADAEMATAPPPVPFADPARTARGEPHATVPLTSLETLWFNTGTRCNIACEGCYIESSPRNDRLLYLARADFDRFLDEAAARHPELAEIGFTGGEPFLNPETPAMIATALERGYRALVLTNAMRPMQRHLATLRRLAAAHGKRLVLRVSLDHHGAAGHDRLRGAGSFAFCLAGLAALAGTGAALAVAARFPPGEDEGAWRAGFAALFAAHGLAIDAFDPAGLVLFPELAGQADPPEVGATCWRALSLRGRRVMCETSRMVVHRRGEAAPRVVACTLQPYEAGFDLGADLASAARPVTLNHPYCARFCVFGAASCTTPTPG
jgi:predicted phosphodiesterase